VLLQPYELYFLVFVVHFEIASFDSNSICIIVVVERASMAFSLLYIELEKITTLKDQVVKTIRVKCCLFWNLVSHKSQLYILFPKCCKNRSSILDIVNINLNIYCFRNAFFLRFKELLLIFIMSSIISFLMGFIFENRHHLYCWWVLLEIYKVLLKYLYRHYFIKVILIIVILIQNKSSMLLRQY